MKNFLRYCLAQTMRMHIDETKLAIRHIKVPKSKIFYFNLSSNPIISFMYDGKLRYFRECPPVLKFEEYFDYVIDRFFSTLDQLHISEEHFKQQIPIIIHFSPASVDAFNAYLNKLRAHRMFLKSISRADRISQKINFSIWDWEPQNYTSDFFHSFGLFDLPADCHDIAIYFVWYMRGAATAYRTLNIARGRAHSYFSAVKSVASKIVADSLGLNHMIPETEFCLIETDEGETLFGVLSNAANGNRMADLNIQSNGSLQKELLNLNVLDLICFQTDHGVDNYNVYEKNNMYSVCAFDNDNPNTFLPIPFIKRNFLGCSPIVNAGGSLNRPYFDEELFRKIKNLDIDLLKKRLKPYLNFMQIKAMVFRIKQIQKMLKKSVSDDPHILIRNDEWSDKTVLAEASGCKCQ